MIERKPKTRYTMGIMATKGTKKKTQKKKGNTPTLLIILDGYGLSKPGARGSAITSETSPNIFGYMKEYAFSKLTAHGEAVGLFPGQQGNSEAGHFNIGAGRVVEQDLVHISHSIQDGTFFKNTAFDQAYFHAKKYKTAVHVMGLLTNNHSAHARPEHLYAMLEYFRKKKHDKVFLHLFTDGRDSPPHSAIRFLRELRDYMKNGEQVATVMGRHYAMDRNKNWERTERAYDALVMGVGRCGMAETAEDAISQAYNRGESDEYICPTIIVKDSKPVGPIQDNDVIFFYNARSDRARQLTKAFVQRDFVKMNPGAFERKSIPQNTRFVAMTDFGPDLPGVLTAFPSPDIENCLAKAIGESYDQLYISETEKYAHVTFFLNGGYPEPINGEERYLVKSDNIKSFENQPEMAAEHVTDEIIERIESGENDFICVNFPNVDMVGHTGNLAAAKKAVRFTDRQVGRLVDTMLANGGQVMITADHGNAEEMYNPKTHEPMTEHSTNPVPCVVISKKMKGKTLEDGSLADVAPTLLKLMGIKKPEEMTGKELY